jgi:fructose-1,6-bisphosphatase/inositol monophosphatase family enzyme
MTKQTTQTAYNTLVRGEGESFEAYRSRRAAANGVVKALKRGKLFHNSAEQGTWINWEKRERREQKVK